MRYIVHKRFKGQAICGAVNLPAGTICECDGIVIKHRGASICAAKSENAHKYFAIDTDNEGMRRGKLTQLILKTLAKRDHNYQARWDKIWADDICQQYRRKDHIDYWLWNHDFYSADIDTLKYILALIGAKEGK